jgi:endonuclease/exonuclease/phosphatase family metal-dependent hydrolase
VAATFRGRDSGVEFRVLNTHLDHFSRRSRMRSAIEILRLVDQSTLPTIVTGDFNTDDESLVHEELMRSGKLLDTWNTARERVTESWGSFPNYGLPTLQGKRIDWILATPTITVLRAGINVTRYDGRWPSDHAPAQAAVHFGHIRS